MNPADDVTVFLPVYRKVEAAPPAPLLPAWVGRAARSVFYGFLGGITAWLVFLYCLILTGG